MSSGLMAIFGTFNDLPLADVLALVGRTSGKFFVMDLPTYVDYEFHFFEGSLIALFANQAPVEDVLYVRQTIVELLRARIGQFRFERKIPEDLLEYFRLPVDQVLLSSMVMMDEMEAMRPFFPNEKTVFVCTKRTEKWMDDELRTFYDSNYPMLHKGASGESIAGNTGQYLDHVLASLYKLRSAGLIAPSRVIARTTVQFTGKETASSSSADLRSVSIARPVQGFFSRLLNKLSSAFVKQSA